MKRNNLFSRASSATLAIFLCTGLGMTVAQAAPTSKIINGTEATSPSDFPWQVALFTDPSQVYASQYCGGTLLSNRWVVTAAHCHEVAGTTYIAAGIIDLDQAQAGQVARVEEWYVHPAFDINTLDNDIALLKLATPLDFSACGANCQPISAVTPANETAVMGIGTTALITGWGARTTDENASVEDTFPTILLSAEVAIVDCMGTGYSDLNVYPEYPITGNMFCAGDATWQYDTCQGDSGGPVMVRDIDGTTPLLAGITSWGEGCAVTNFPGVYTRVSQYKNWIDDTTAVHCCDSDATVFSQISSSKKNNDKFLGALEGWWLVGVGLVLFRRRSK